MNPYPPLLTMTQILLILYLPYANIRYGLFPSTFLSFPSIALTMITVEPVQIMKFLLVQYSHFLGTWLN